MIADDIQWTPLPFKPTYTKMHVPTCEHAYSEHGQDVQAVHGMHLIQLNTHFTFLTGQHRVNA
jgi:hypothetical protein